MADSPDLSSSSFVTRFINSINFTKSSNPAVDSAIERAVDMADSKIRRVRKYKQALYPAMEKAVQYSSELVASIPQSIPLSQHEYGSNPLIRSFFSSPEQITKLVATVSSQPDRDHQLHALLTMSQNEKTTFTNKQHGELMARDVAVKTVNFFEHLLVAATSELSETKKLLEERALEVLSVKAMENIEERKVNLEELREQKTRIQSMIRIVKGRNKAFSNFATVDLESRNKLEELTRQLEVTNSNIEKLKLEIGTPRQSLDLLYDILNCPDEVLTIHHRKLRLNWMNSVVEDTKEEGDEISFIEFRLGDELKRQGALVHFEVTR